MLAGRPHEAAGNGSPRWMTADPRERVHRTRPTGRLTPINVADLRRNGHQVSWFRPCSVRATAKIASMVPRPKSSVGMIECCGMPTPGEPSQILSDTPWRLDVACGRAWPCAGLCG